MYNVNSVLNSMRTVMSGNVKKLSFALVIFLVPLCAFSATSVSQYGITWNFDKDYVVGTFVNGDYYVVDDGGGVTVVSVSPGPSSGSNGSMVNPVSGGNHGFDSGARGGYNSSLQASFPLELNAGDSLVSSISLSGGGSGWNGGSIDSKALLKTAAVLTVMNRVPPPGTFRPSYVDREQTLYNFANIRRDVLPGLSTSGIAKPSAHGFDSPLAYLKRGLQRPWLLFVHEWPGRDIHPADNMFGYQRSIGEFLSELYTYLVTDQPIDDQLLAYVVQLGIDYHHIGISGNGDSSYYVMPSLMAGFLLNDRDMLNAFRENRIQSVPRDYPDFYFASDSNASLKSSLISLGQTWNGFSVFFRNNTASNREYEHLHPSEWDDSYDHWKDNSYRLTQDSHPHVGMVLTARLLGLQDEWSHEATFAYIDRWMVEDHVANARVMSQFGSGGGGADIPRSGSSFIDDMWAKYRQNQPRRPQAPSIISVVPQN